jgi:hypothetical protein
MPFSPGNLMRERQKAKKAHIERLTNLFGAPLVLSDTQQQQQQQTLHKHRCSLRANVVVASRI